MQFRRTKNDAILQPFLLARDDAESEKQLAVLLEQHSEEMIKSIIMGRLRSDFFNYTRHPYFEDLYNEALMKVVAYLRELKSNRDAQPCRDFRGYVATITHNICNDYLREMYPARTRLYGRLRHLLNTNPDFAIWKSNEEDRGNWVCGFENWKEKKSASGAQDWFESYSQTPGAFFESLELDQSAYQTELDDLLAAIFNYVGGPVKVDEIVSVIADIKGIRDMPQTNINDLAYERLQGMSESSLRIDEMLEMRATLRLFWEKLCLLPREEFKVYTLYARDTSGEDIITLFLAARIATESEIAEQLEMSMEQVRDLWLNRLPLDNDSIARELGIKVERVYKLRCQAGKRMKTFLPISKVNF